MADSKVTPEKVPLAEKPVEQIGASGKSIEKNQLVLLLGLVGVSLAVSVVQHSQILNGGDVGAWVDSLFAPHVVAPPTAHDHICTIQFCQSWGTNGLYQQINQLIQSRASVDLNVVPAAYPAPPMHQFLASTVGMFQMLLILNVFLNERLMPDYIKENKMASVFGIFLVLNMIASGLTKTNAFEIYVGKTQVWSTMKHDRMPNMNDLVKGFKLAGITLG